MIYDITNYFIENSDLYKEGITLNAEWFVDPQDNLEVKFSSDEDLNCLQTEDAGKASSATGNTDEKDTWNELTEEEQAGAGNKDTMLQNNDFSDDGLHALQLANGENNHPIGLFIDTYAEEKSI